VFDSTRSRRKIDSIGQNTPYNVLFDSRCCTRAQVSHLYSMWWPISDPFFSDTEHVFNILMVSVLCLSYISGTAVKKAGNSLLSAYYGNMAIILCM